MNSSIPLKKVGLWGPIASRELSFDDRGMRSNKSHLRALATRQFNHPNLFLGVHAIGSEQPRETANQSHHRFRIPLTVLQQRRPTFSLLSS